MANRTNGQAKVIQYRAGDERSVFGASMFVGIIFALELLMRVASGKIDQAGPGEADPVFCGVSMQDADASDSNSKLSVLRKGKFKAVVAASDAAADAKQAFRIKGSGTGNAIVLADQKKKLYAEDGRTLTVAPADPSSPLCGYIDVVTVIGTNGDGECQVVLDADWAAAQQAASDVLSDAALGIASQDFNGVDIGDRQVLVERFNKRPLLAADILNLTDSSGGSANNTIAAITTGGAAADQGPTRDAIADLAAKVNNLLLANADFEVAGTNMTSALVTFAANGGVTLTTAGAANDQSILQPRSVANTTGWNVGINTAKKPRLAARFALNGTTLRRFKAGLALTNAIDTTTDDDQVFVLYDTALNHTNWMIGVSIGGVDAALVDSGVAVTTDDVRVVIDVDANRIARVYINDVLKHTTAALTSLATLKPFVAQQTLENAAKAFTIRYEGKSNDF